MHAFWCIHANLCMYTSMHRFVHTLCAFVMCGGVWGCVCVSLSVSVGLAVLKWQCLINGARLCPWFVCFLLIITNMGWNIWVTKIDIMMEYALLSSSYIRLANFWRKAKCLGNITSYLSSPSHLHTAYRSTSRNLNKNGRLGVGSFFFFWLKKPLSEALTWL